MTDSPISSSRTSNGMSRSLRSHVGGQPHHQWYTVTERNYGCFHDSDLKTPSARRVSVFTYGIYESSRGTCRFNVLRKIYI